MVQLSILIPAHNESENLKILLPRLKKVFGSTKNYEIVVVDNASTDNSGEVLRKLQSNISELIVIKEPTLGYGRAIKAGLKNAKGDTFSIIRADNQERPEDLAKMYEYFRNSNFDLYKAVRKNRISDGLIRIIVSKIYNLLFRLMFHTNVKDINATPKIFKQEFCKKLELESNDWFIDAEIIIKTLRLGGKIKEMEIEYLPRLKGKSTVKPIHLYEFLKNMFVWYHRIKVNNLKKQ